MNYDELRAALSAYMKRTDPETVANEPTALELARLVVGKTFFPHEAEQTIDALVLDDTGAAVLPADFGRAVAVGGDMGYITPRQWRLLSSAPRHVAGFYTIYGGALHCAPGLDTVSLVYNRAPEPITAAGSNWLSTLYPQVWLHAARAEQYRFVEDVESAVTVDQYWRALAGELAAASEGTRQAGGLIRMKSR